jgi:hypothetical protein
VEARAAEVAATITENEKANAWHEAFELAGKFIRRAKAIHEKDESAAASLARAALAILESIQGGFARGQFNVGVNVNAMTQSFPSIAFDDSGAPVDPSAHFIQSYEQAVALLEKGEDLPCDNWNPDSIHATPNVNHAVTEAESPSKTADMVSEEPPERTVPSRMDSIPTRDNERSRGHLDVRTEDEDEPRLPSFKMFDNVSIIQRARSVAGDPQ